MPKRRRQHGDGRAEVQQPCKRERSHVVGQPRRQRRRHTEQHRRHRATDEPGSGGAATGLHVTHAVLRTASSQRARREVDRSRRWSCGQSIIRPGGGRDRAGRVGSVDQQRADEADEERQVCDLTEQGAAARAEVDDRHPDVHDGDDREDREDAGQEDPSGALQRSRDRRRGRPRG